MKKQIVIALCAVILFQLLVLLGEYGNAVYPLYTGEEITIKTRPFDPRSLFRGNYARLRYEISTVPGEEINLQRTPRNGEVVYVRLQQGENGIYDVNGASLEKPDEGLFIRGRIQTNRWSGTRESYEVKYGIEAFFAPKKKALKLERELRETAVAKVMVAGNGKACLVDILPGG